MELPELRSTIRRHIVGLRRIQASLATSLARQYRPATAIRIRAGGIPTHMCAAGGRAACGQLF